MRRNLQVGGLIVIAAFALFGGGALAASHYLITSTGQIKPNVLKQLRGNTGPRGPQGQAGQAGGFSTTNVTQVSGPTVTLCASGGGSCDVESSDATCPAGSVVLGGGWNWGSTASPPVEATVSLDSPAVAGSQDWEVLMVNNSSVSASFSAVATCATPSGTAADIARSGRLTAQQRAQIATQVAAARMRVASEQSHR